MKLSYVTRFFSGGQQVRGEGESRGVTTAFSVGRNFFRRRRSRSVGAGAGGATGTNSTAGASQTLIRPPAEPNPLITSRTPTGASAEDHLREGSEEQDVDEPEVELGASGASSPLRSQAEGEGSTTSLSQPKTMFLIQKYTQYKAAQAEQQKRKVTEKELAQLNHKIDKLLTKLDEHEPEIAVNQDEECVVCVHAKATMQTYPCGHRVVCRKCFVKTIQMAVAQRLLPLRCVICRAKILRLKHSTGLMQPLPSSASQYTIGHHWYNVPQSASLYSVSSNASAASGVSSASSCSSASSYKTCASSFSSASFRKPPNGCSKIGYKPLRTSSLSPSRENTQPRSSIAIAMAKKDNRVAPAETAVPPRGKLTLIQEFRREFSNGKESSSLNHKEQAKIKLHGADNHHHSHSSGGNTRIKTARHLVSQAQSSGSGGCSGGGSAGPSNSASYGSISKISDNGSTHKTKAGAGGKSNSTTNLPSMNNTSGSPSPMHSSDSSSPGGGRRGKSNSSGSLTAATAVGGIPDPHLLSPAGPPPSRSASIGASSDLGSSASSRKGNGGKNESLGNSTSASTLAPLCLTPIRKNLGGSVAPPKKSTSSFRLSLARTLGKCKPGKDTGFFGGSLKKSTGGQSPSSGAEEQEPLMDTGNGSSPTSPTDVSPPNLQSS